jgi:hypothetical protein
MKDFAADDLQAADLLALARLDDDGRRRRRPARTLPAPRRYAYPRGSAPRPPSQPALLAPWDQPGSRTRQRSPQPRRARERFLTAEPVGPGQVRESILASWRRSREWHVAAGRIDLSYARDPDLDTPLARTALPVLQNLRESLQGELVSVILTDAHGWRCPG